MSSSRGTILILVLLFLTIISGLSLISMNSVVIENKIQHYAYSQTVLNEIAEIALSQGETLINRVFCQSSNTIPNAFWNQAALTWWETNACRNEHNHIEFFYFIEELDTACVMIKPTTVGARFYRVTVRVGDTTNPIIAQTTYALPTAIPLNCKNKLRPIKPGRQSWRKIE